MGLAADAASTARDAAGREAWREALDAYSQVDPRDLTPDDLALFAEAAWWRGDAARAIELRERAYAGYVAAGERVSAAGIALALSVDHEARGAMAVQQGWLSTAERLLRGEPESAAHGRLAILRAHALLSVYGDVAAATPLIERARAVAERLDDRDLAALAGAVQGTVLIRGGDVDDGLALLDESAAAAVCGNLRPVTTGIVYCCMISACDDIGDYRRAAEWTEAANRWSDRMDVTGFPGVCRVHRASLMRLRGDWSAAEAQALAACDEVQQFDRLVTAAGFYEVGEIRRRRGDFAAAAEMYRRADDWGREPYPGLALLQLAEGKLDAAASGIRRALDDADPLRRAMLLPAQLEIAVAAGDLATARASAEELDRIVDAYRVDRRPAAGFEAARQLAWGSLALAEDDPTAAVRRLRKARSQWDTVGAPYEIAQVRMLLGIAYRRAGDESGAVAELEAAAEIFARLGARLDEERTKELLGRREMRRTFLFTDIVGSTRLLETLGNEKWRRLLARHDELLRERIATAGGEVVKQTGDGFFASFVTPKHALDAAAQIQRALEAEIVAPDVRIGVHTGGAFRTDDGADLGGEGVHAAARIGALAGPGEILASRETVDGVAGFSVSKARQETLKGFSEPIELVAIGWR